MDDQEEPRISEEEDHKDKIKSSAEEAEIYNFWTYKTT